MKKTIISLLAILILLSGCTGKTRQESIIKQVEESIPGSVFIEEKECKRYHYIEYRFTDANDVLFSVKYYTDGTITQTSTGIMGRNTTSHSYLNYFESVCAARMEELQNNAPNGIRIERLNSGGITLYVSEGVSLEAVAEFCMKADRIMGLTIDVDNIDLPNMSPYFDIAFYDEATGVYFLSEYTLFGLSCEDNGRIEYEPIYGWVSENYNWFIKNK